MFWLLIWHIYKKLITYKRHGLIPLLLGHAHFASKIEVLVRFIVDKFFKSGAHWVKRKVMKSKLMINPNEI